MERIQSKVQVILKEGTRLPSVIDAEEIQAPEGLMYRVSVTYGGALVTEESAKGFFDALCKARLVLERDGVLLCCFGASEDVYPSPMQQSMGPALLAYRMQLGQQARSEDIVNILDFDETVKPSTVEQQKLFRQKWFQSLAARGDR